MENFGKNILFLRKKRGLKQSEMPDFTGVSRATWSDYENSKTEPDFSTLVKISDLFKIAIDDLLRRDLQQEYEKGNLIELEDTPRKPEKGNLKGNPIGNRNAENDENSHSQESTVSEAEPDAQNLLLQILQEIKGLRQDINKNAPSSET